MIGWKIIKYNIFQELKLFSLKFMDSIGQLIMSLTENQCWGTGQQIF